MEIIQRDRVPTETAYNFQGLTQRLLTISLIPWPTCLPPLPQEQLRGEYMGITGSKTLPSWLGTPEDSPLGPAGSCRFQRKLCFQELTPRPLLRTDWGWGWVGRSIFEHTRKETLQWELKMGGSHGAKRAVPRSVLRSSRLGSPVTPPRLRWGCCPLFPGPGGTAASSSHLLWKVVGSVPLPSSATPPPNSARFLR